jgi:hypothetical protein
LNLGLHSVTVRRVASSQLQPGCKGARQLKVIKPKTALRHHGKVLARLEKARKAFFDATSPAGAHYTSATNAVYLTVEKERELAFKAVERSERKMYLRAGIIIEGRDPYTVLVLDFSRALQDFDRDRQKQLNRLVLHMFETGEDPVMARLSMTNEKT